MEYPSANVSQGELDPSIQTTLKEQDFIQIILKYLSALFPTTASLYDFVEMYRYFQMEQKRDEQDDDGFNKAQSTAIEVGKDQRILSQKDRIVIQIEIKRKDILLVCYGLLEAMCKDSEANQVLCSQYLPLIQMHSYFFPELLEMLARVFPPNQEILLQLKKKKTYSQGILDIAGLNIIPGMDMLSLPRIDTQIQKLVQGFYEVEGITSGASNFFYFFCFYLLKSNSVDVRHKILDLFRKVSVYGGESISTNQDEIYNQIKTNFKELIKNQFYTLASRQNEFVLINPNNLKAEPFDQIFGTKNDPLESLPAKDDNNEVQESEQGVQIKHMNTTQQKAEEELAQAPHESLPQLTEENNNQSMVTDRKPAEMGEQFYSEPSERELLDGGAGRINSELNEEQKRFALAQLDFYAGMTLDRNYVWKGLLETRGYFTYDVLLEAVFKRYEETPLNASLLRVLHEMYLDQYPMYYLVVPQYCKIIAASGESYKQSPNMSPTGSPRNTNIPQGLSPTSSPGKKRKAGFNFHASHENASVKALQQKLQDYFKDVARAFNYLPITFEELRKQKEYDNFQIVQKIIISEQTLEAVRAVKTIFDFGHYAFKVAASEARYLPCRFKDFTEERNLTPLLRTMLKILSFEPEYPETRQLLTSLRKSIKKLRADENEVEEFEKKMETFRYEEQYDKIKMVEDVEKKDDAAFSIYEAYFRQFLAKDIAFKNHFKYRNSVLEKLKIQIMAVVERTLCFVTDSYANKIMAMFEACVIDNTLVDRVTRGEFISDVSKITDLFSQTINDKAPLTMPPISFTGLSLDFLKDELKEDIKAEEMSLNALTLHSLFPTLLLIFTFNQECEELSAKSIELLIKVFSQRVQIQTILNNVNVIQGVNSIKEYKSIKRDHCILIDLCDEAENWIRATDLEVRNKNIEKIVDILDRFCGFLSAPEDENLGSDQLHQLDHFTINRTMQEIFRNLKVHETIVDFIRDTFYTVCEYYEDATDPEILFYFEALFLFLRKFVYKNPTNQKLLSRDITVFLQPSLVEVGQVSAIIEIFKDNETLAKTMASIVTDDFIRWILKYGRRERMMDFFINLMKCGDSYLVDNQRKILALFLEHPKKHDLLFTKTVTENDGKLANELQFEPKINPEDRFYYDEPYRYHSKVLRMLCYSCAGKSGVYVNEVKVRSLFRLKYLVKMLFWQDAMTDPDAAFERNFLPIPDTESPVGSFANLPDESPSRATRQLKKRYLSIDVPDRNSNSHSNNPSVPASPTRQKHKRTIKRRKSRLGTKQMADLLTKQGSSKKSNSILKIAILELIYYVYFESSSISEEVIQLKKDFIELFKVETKRLKGLQKEHITQDYVEYLFENLLRISVAVTTFLLKEGKQNEESEEEDTDLLNIRPQISSEPMKDKFDMKEFIDALGNKLDLFEDDVLKTFNKELTQAADKFEFEFGQRVHDVNKPKETKSPDEEIITQPSSEIYKYLWKYFLSSYNGSLRIQEGILQEKDILSKALNQIEDLFKIPINVQNLSEDAIKPIMINLNKTRVIKSIINFVMENAKDISKQSTLVEVLYCLGGMIPLEKNEINDGNRAFVKREQAFLQECGATIMIMKQLTDPQLPLKADDYTLNLISFAVKLLEGGNSDVQSEFYSAMKTDSTAEVFFNKVFELFKKETDYLNRGEISPDLQVVLMILKLIQRFAEGHFTDLQLYMREQTNSMRSYNLLEGTVTLLSIYISKKEKRRKEYFDVIMQCFDTITELIQGPCYENQKSIMQGRLMETVGQVLSIDEYLMIEAENRKIDYGAEPGCLRPWMIAKIKHKCSITLISLIECRKDNIILRKMYTNLKKSFTDNIISFHTNYYALYKDKYDEEVLEHVEATPDMGYDELHCSMIIQTAFHLYSIMRNNQEAEDDDEGSSSDSSKSDDEEEDLPEAADLPVQGQPETKAPEEQEEVEVEVMRDPTTLNELKRYMDQKRMRGKKAAYQFMAQKTRSIEVVRADECLERVYFLTLPYFEAITDNIKDEFNQEVTRVSCKTKCNDLLEKSKELISKVKTERNILKNRFLRLIQKNYNKIKLSSFFFVIMVNLLSLIFYVQGAADELVAKEAIDRTPKWVYSVQVVLGVFIVLHGLLILGFDLYKEIPFLKTEVKLQGWRKMFKHLFNERGFIFYYLLYVVIGVVAWFYPAWYTFHLNDILNINTVLRNIVKSVWRPRSSMLLTLVLFMIVMYTYAAIGFVYFKQQYAKSMPDDIPCESIFQCWVLTFDKGFKFDGGIGNYLADHNENLDESGERVPVDMMRFLFENSLLIFNFIIILNIVTGIIIDTFGSLREEYNAYIEDTETYCFICGHDRESLEKEFEGDEGVDGFEFHVKHEHYQWNYLFYIGYLQDKKDTEYTGLESHIADLIDQEDIGWFPAHRAMMIKEEDGMEANEAADEEIQTINQQQAILNKLTIGIKKDLVEYQNKKEMKKVNFEEDLDKFNATSN